MIRRALLAIVAKGTTRQIRAARLGRTILLRARIFKGHGKLAGGEVHTDKQERQSADLSYSFNVISGCFDIAGTYELIFTVLNADIHDPVTTRSKEIVWKQTFVVAPGQTPCSPLS